MPEPLLSTADWFASLSTVYLSASMLITDQDDRILLVKPNYRPDWGIPGGIVEADEAPDQCATREIAEELGLDIPAGDLLVVDWVAAAEDRPQAIMNFIFDGGVLGDPGAIRLQEEELDDAQFLDWAEAEARMAGGMAPRVPAARQARQSRRTVYLPSQRRAGVAAGAIIPAPHRGITSRDNSKRRGGQRSSGWRRYPAPGAMVAGAGVRARPRR